jgi:hypothetical protein
MSNADKLVADLRMKKAACPHVWSPWLKKEKPGQEPRWERDCPLCKSREISKGPPQ